MSVPNLLGDRSFFDRKDNTILPLNSYNGWSSSHGLHGIFDLQQVSIGTEYGNGTIVRHFYSDPIRLSAGMFLCWWFCFVAKQSFYAVWILSRLTKWRVLLWRVVLDHAANLCRVLGLNSYQFCRLSSFEPDRKVQKKKTIQSTQHFSSLDWGNTK
jgi:hypothetical protein